MAGNNRGYAGRSRQCRQKGVYETSRHQKDMGKTLDTEGFQEIGSCLHGPIILGKIQNVTNNYQPSARIKFWFGR